jgi:predicted CXXCH cytochrome family protein
MKLDDAVVIHEPLTTGECTGCHDPHGGADRMLLKAPTVDGLCQTCHENLIAGKSKVHGPVAAGACSICHAPHASAHPGLLATTGRDLCTSCHVSTETQLDTMRVVHEPPPTTS